MAVSDKLQHLIDDVNSGHFVSSIRVADAYIDNPGERAAIKWLIESKFADSRQRAIWILVKKIKTSQAMKQYPRGQRPDTVPKSVLPTKSPEAVKEAANRLRTMYADAYKRIMGE